MIYAPTTATMEGRWVDTGSGCYTVLSAGSALRFRFTGTQVTVYLQVPARTYPTEVEWCVDGGSWNRATTTSAMTLATGLANQQHTAELRLAGSANDDNRWANHLGLSVTGLGADTIGPWPRLGKKLAVVGDSIGEGNLVLGYSASGEPNRPQYDGGRLAFGRLLADAYNAELWPFSFGGASIVATSQGTPALDVAYGYAMQGVPFTGPTYDVVIIEGGHNDGTANSAVFQAHYGNLIDQIRSTSPSAAIFCLRPITSWAPDRAADVAAVSAAKGCTYVDTSGWAVSAPNLGHPNTAGQAAMAAYLNPIVGPALVMPSVSFHTNRRLVSVAAAFQSVRRLVAAIGIPTLRRLTNYYAIPVTRHLVNVQSKSVTPPFGAVDTTVLYGVTEPQGTTGADYTGPDFGVTQDD